MPWRTLLLTIVMLPVYQQKKIHQESINKTRGYHQSSLLRDYPLRIEECKFMAGIVVASEKWTYWRCAATIIGKHWAVTTAECVYDLPQKLFQNGYFRIRGNTTFLQGTLNDYVDHTVQEYFIHDSYVGDLNMYDDNIALLKTKTGFTGLHEQPVNLPLEHMSTATYSSITEGTVYRWKDMILKGDLAKVVNNKECRTFYKWLGKHVSDKMLCAQAVLNSAEFCYGTKGSPLVVDKILIGLVSYSEECSTDHFPATFIKVECFVEWINKTMETHGNDPEENRFLYKHYDYT